jgi:hypothetical protein
MALNPTCRGRARIDGSATNAGLNDSSYPGNTDYSDRATAFYSDTWTFPAGSTDGTCAGSGVTAPMVGNGIYITGSDRTTGRYIITVVLAANQIRVDAAPSAAGLSGVVGKIGGAGLVGDVRSCAVAGFTTYYGPGTHTLTASTSAPVDGSNTAACTDEGYAVTAGDKPTNGNRPTIACGTYTFNVRAQWFTQHLQFTGTAAAVWAVVTSGSGYAAFVKSTNSSGTASRSAFFANTSRGMFLQSCEGISTNGIGGSFASVGRLVSCYLHDSASGATPIATFGGIVGCVFDTCTTGGNHGAGDVGTYDHCTFYGCTTGINMGMRLQWSITNCIFHTCTTGISETAYYPSNLSDYNDFWACGTPRVNYPVGPHDTATNPNFPDPANGDFTPSGSVLTQGSGPPKSDGTYWTSHQGAIPAQTTGAGGGSKAYFREANL